jgi:hypothetical protein
MIRFVCLGSRYGLAHGNRMINRLQPDKHICHFFEGGLGMGNLLRRFGENKPTEKGSKTAQTYKKEENSLQIVDSQDLRPYTTQEIVQAQELKIEKEFDMAIQAWKTGDTNDLNKFVKEVNNPLLIPVADEDQRLMKDPRSEKDSYVSIEKSDTGLLGGLTRNNNEDTHIRVKDNPLVAEVLANKLININDARVKVESLDLQNLSLIKDSGDLAQLQLGKVEVLKQDAVSLKDVDINNIPEHLDVIVSPKQKEVILLGRKISTSRFELSDEVQGAYDSGGRDKQVSEYTQRVQPQVFNEKSHQEFQDEVTFFFDPKFRISSPADSVSRFFRGVPLVAFLVCFLSSYLEDRQVDVNPRLLEEQELTELETFKRQQILRMSLQHNGSSLADFLGSLDTQDSAY